MTDQTVPPVPPAPTVPAAPHLTIVPPAPAPAPQTPLAALATSDNILEFTKAFRKAQAKARWSQNVIDRGYTMIPTILLWGQAKLGLTADELNTLLQIISHWFYAGNDPHPAKATIALRMGKHPRTVQDYITSLENKGFIKRVKRYRGSKAQDSNGFDLSGLAAKLEAIAPEFEKATKANKARRAKAEAPAAS